MWAINSNKIIISSRSNNTRLVIFWFGNVGKITLVVVNVENCINNLANNYNKGRYNIINIYYQVYVFSK